jgi:hypothetical protein
MLYPHLINFCGRSVNRKTVIFESDDWGAIRSTSKLLYPKFIKRFPAASSNPYLRYDTLASSEDLTALFDVISRYKDINGSHAIFTFNTVVANPVFSQIEKSQFVDYCYEPFTATLERYYPNQDVFQSWRQGISAGLIYPQFHGREHVNVPAWLELLKEGDPDLLDAFQFGTWSTPSGRHPTRGIKLQAALDWAGEQPLDYQKAFIAEGLALFQKSFGFKSKTMIANNFILDTNLHPAILENGVCCLQGMKYQVLPYGNRDKHRYIRRKFGVKDEYGMNFTIRNCSFEPAQTKPGYDDVGMCLKQIQAAFYWKKPAIIATHRLNYIGEMVKGNRKENLVKLNELLLAITNRWKEIEFCHSSQAANLIDS